MKLETSEEIRGQFDTMLGWGGMHRGVDVLNRADYVTEDDFLNACAKYDMQHEDSAFREAKRKATIALREKQQAEQEAHANEVMKNAIANSTLEGFDQKQAEQRARERTDRAIADGEPVSRKGELFSVYYAEEERKAKEQKAHNVAMNQLFRESLYAQRDYNHSTR